MKIKQLNAILSPIIILLLAILACNMPQASPTPDLEMLVAQTQTAIAVEKVLPIASETPQSTILPTVPQTPPATPKETVATPTATVLAQQDCIDKAKFIGESIPDGTVFTPGESFIKTWTLVNAGTCAWTPGYSLVFVSGEQMGGTSPSPIGQSVPAEGQIQLYLPQTAPLIPGEHQGFWKIRNTRGQDFGLGNNADVAFWVKIITLPGSEDSGGSLNLGQPSWKDNFDQQSSSFYLGKDEDISFKIENGELVMTAFEPDGDQWRIAELHNLVDFYIEARFKNGPKCSGKDSYGLIVRAPDQPDGIIDSGLVFGFSCEGLFRVYRMDNGNYSGIEGWSENFSIKSGPDQDNTMGIMVKGDNYKLFANGTKIFEFTDVTYSNGLFGLMIRSDATENLHILVKEIAYWNLQ